VKKEDKMYKRMYKIIMKVTMAFGLCLGILIIVFVNWLNSVHSYLGITFIGGVLFWYIIESVILPRIYR